MVDVSLKCSCGKVRGLATNISPHSGTRVVCYCDDCQAFARYLGRETDVLDQYGGTDIFQITPAQILITQGADLLRCMRLKPDGLIRWYTECCKTPVCNTVSATLPFTGLIHNFMDNRDTRDTQLGPVRYYVQGKFARGKPADLPVYSGFPLRSMMRIVPWLLFAMLRRQNRPNPFFDSAGKPVSTPNVFARDA